MADAYAKLGIYQNGVAKTFPPKVQEALRMIGEPSRELLALRRYIRKAKTLDAQWVWSPQQMKDYEHSPHAMQVRAEIAKVTKQFEKQNPGYTLGTSPIRDLARQVRLWNGNHTVREAAGRLRTKCLQEIEAPAYSDVPSADSISKFKRFLGECAVHPEPTSAAPGLSDHGQMHAIDFIIVQGNRKIADTISSSIPIAWIKPQWDQKLKLAVQSSGSRFDGPLPHPPEPWHYWIRH
jgi:hypothetical protein